MNNSFDRRAAVGAACLLTLFARSVLADDTSGNAPVRAASHAPIGVMGDHTHGRGEWMLSYRFMRMDMDGNRIGHRSVSPDFIATNVPNRFAGQPMQPPTLRVVPVEMTMDMHMFGLMYAPSDRWTLMAMLNYVEKEMDHITYQGPAGTTVLGTFTTRSSGLGDTTLAGLFRLRDEPDEKWHLNLGLSLPTGDTDETDRVLAPTGMQPVLRLPYAMQLGSGTWDLKPGITYNGRRDRLTWGAQYTGTFRTGENDDGYTLGNRQDLTAWVALSPRPWFSFSGRLAYADVDRIDGIDPEIVAPVQTANPDYYGGSTVEAFVGLNVAGQHGALRNHRLALEYGVPLSQDLNGPQMEADSSLTFGWQYSF